MRILQQQMKIKERYESLLEDTVEVTKMKIYKTCFLNQGLSFKRGVNVCRHLSKRSFSDALEISTQAINFIQPIPLRVHQGGVGHKKSLAAGRFCVKFNKFLQMALRNIVKTHNTTAEKLKIIEIYVTKGKTRRRVIKKAKGQSDVTKLKSCNVYLGYQFIS